MLVVDVMIVLIFRIICMGTLYVVLVRNLRLSFSNLPSIFLSKAATQLARQVQQERTLVVRSNNECSRKPPGGGCDYIVTEMDSDFSCKIVSPIASTT